MTILRDWPISISLDEVLHILGADPEVIRQRNPRACSRVEKAVTHGPYLLDSSVTFEERRVIGLRHEKLKLETGSMLSGRSVTRFLASAERVLIVACTIGSRLEEAVSQVFEDDPAYALALDSYGSLAVDALASATCNYLVEQFTGTARNLTMPLSPGMEGWTVNVGQRQIFSVIDSEQAGIRLTPTGQMIPKKSTTFVIGFGENVITGGRPCDYCTMRDTCRYQEHYG